MLFHDMGMVTRDMLEDLLKASRIDGAEAALQVVAGAAFPDGRQAASIHERLADLLMPVLIVRGADDANIPLEQSAGLPSNFWIETIPRCGHMPHIEAAPAVNRAIAEHLL
jgi:pyruvate dehydrogenase E2 component (dihydrolipoamide acetyltransferase)